MGSIVSSITAVASASLSASNETVIFRATWSGRNGAGAISIPGLQAGDRMLQLIDSAPSVISSILSWTEVVVSVADELHQNHTGDLTPNTYDALFVRGL